MTTRTLGLTPPLIPNGSHWRLPSATWVQQQQEASRQHTKPSPWWHKVLTAPAHLLGIVDDSLQGSETPGSGRHLPFLLPAWTAAAAAACPSNHSPMLLSAAAYTQHDLHSHITAFCAWSASHCMAKPRVLNWLPAISPASCLEPETDAVSICVMSRRPSLDIGQEGIGLAGKCPAEHPASSKQLPMQ